MRVLLLLGIAAALLAMGGCTLVVPESALPTAAAPAAPAQADPITTTVPITGTIVPTATLAPTATATVTATPVITATTMPTVTAIPTATAGPTATAIATPVESPIPTDTPSLPPTATPIPTLPPTATPVPTATPTPGPSPTPTPLPAAVVVGSHRSFAEGNSLVLVGEVINGSGAPVYNVRVIATFYDAANQLIAATEGMTYLPQTIQTQRNPFRLQLQAAPGNVSRYELTLRWDDLTVGTYDRATITREEVAQTNGVVITGDLRNDQRRDLRNLVVVATFYDAAGTVLDVVPGSAAMNTLPPGGATTFTVQSARPIPFASYLVQVEGQMLP